MVFKPVPGKPLLLPRERYGIEFYGLQDGETLVIVDISRGSLSWNTFPIGSRMAYVPLC